MQEILFSTTLNPSWGRAAQSKLQLYEERLDCADLRRGWIVQIWRESWRNKHQGPYAEPFSHTAHRHPFLDEAFPSMWHQPGECNSPTFWTACRPTLQSSCTAEKSAAWARGVEVWMDLGRLRNWVLCLWGEGQFSFTLPNWCRALPWHSQILVALGLTNSVGLPLKTPWDPTPPQRSAAMWQEAHICHANGIKK